MVRPLTSDDARAIAAWRYSGRYSTYRRRDPDLRASVGGHARSEARRYCCVGEGARVPGIDEEEGTLDMGYGMRPD